jgi:DNA-binding LacI/PurR family transcriptional regulator
MAKNRTVSTMKDVARLASVSIQTVSAVINGKTEITESTRQRVLQAVEQLHYRPYAVGRSLRTRETRTIAFIVSDIANPSIGLMASVAEDVAYRAGYNLALYSTRDDAEREARTLLTAVQRWHDGVLFLSVNDHMTSLRTLKQAGIPAVAIDRISEGYGGPSITLNNLQAGRLAAEHLVSLGHKQLAHIGGPVALRLARERLAGFREVLTQHGIPSEQIAVDVGNWTCESGYAAMQRLMARSPRPTALFAANDRMAIGAMQAAHQAGLHVPADLSVVGLDDIEVAAMHLPPLTTIRQPFARLITLGIELLLDLIAGRAAEHAEVILEPEFILRSSTQPSRQPPTPAG